MGTVPSSAPPVYSAVARGFAAIRMQCWSSAQLSALDALINMLCADLHEIQPRFDEERFKKMALFKQGVYR